MKPENELEKLIANSGVDTDPTADKRNLAQLLRTQQASRLNRPSPGWTFFAPARLATAVILLAAGFIVARATAPKPVDAAQIENSLRASLQADVANVVAKKLAAMPATAPKVDTEEIAAAVWMQLQARMPDLMATILQASEARTNERLKEMATMIDQARAQDRIQVANALERMETSRLEDRYTIGQGLVRLAARTDKTDFPRK